MTEKNRLTTSEKIKVDLRRHREAVNAGFEAIAATGDTELLEEALVASRAWRKKVKEVRNKKCNSSSVASQS